NFNAVQKEFQGMVEASYILLNSTDNPVLLDEIRPWVKQFQLLGQSGLSMLNMYKALQAKDTDDFERSYQAIKAIKTHMYAIDRTENQNPFQPGVKTGSLVIVPLIDNGFAYLTNSYNKTFNKHLEVEANYNPHKLYTNVAQLQNQQVTLRDRTLALNPPLEVIRLESQSYFGFELQDAILVSRVSFKATPTLVYEHLKLEVSSNGTDWEIVPTKEDKEVMQASVNKKVKYVRVINTTSGTVESKIELFTVIVK
ncbi:MAG: O-GlcNAcase, partial [Gelidibacter sp.]